MPTCPICQTESPAEAEVCTGCGAFRFRTDPDSATCTLAQAPAITPSDGPPVPLGADVSDPESPAPPTFSEPDLIATPMSPVPVPRTNPPADPDPTAPPPPRLVVIRGQRVNAEYQIYPGRNFIGRTTDKPADIDLTGQEPPEQVWSSRLHAVIIMDRGGLSIEDLNSLNGTFVNRTRLFPGQPWRLSPNDVIAIGVVQLKVVL